MVVGVSSTRTYKTAAGIYQQRENHVAMFKPRQSEELRCEMNAIPLNPTPMNEHG